MRLEIWKKTRCKEREKCRPSDRCIKKQEQVQDLHTWTSKMKHSIQKRCVQENIYEKRTLAVISKMNESESNREIDAELK
jgi:hypothetical protein